MSFVLSRLSTDVPLCVLDVAFERTERPFHIRNLPPQTETNVTGRCEIAKDNYRTTLRITTIEGRTAVICMGRFGGELHMRGNIAPSGDAVCRTAEGKVNSFFSAERKVGLHFRKDGCLAVQALENFHWELKGEEVDELLVELPTFMQANTAPVHAPQTVAVG